MLNGNRENRIIKNPNLQLLKEIFRWDYFREGFFRGYCQSLVGFFCLGIVKLIFGGAFYPKNLKGLFSGREIFLGYGEIDHYYRNETGNLSVTKIASFLSQKSMILDPPNRAKPKLNGQYHQDLVEFENLMKVSV